MDPNQEGQPTQGGSVPPTSPASGMPPEQAAGVPPAQTDGSAAPGMPPASQTQPTEGSLGPAPALLPEQPASAPASNPVFGTQGTMPMADASGTPATPPLTPRRSFRSTQTNPAGAANQFAQPAQGQPGVIASGAQPAASTGKKPSKGLIIAIIVVAVLAIVAVIVGIVASNSSNNNSKSSSSSTSTPVNMTELATAYNSLANYIAFGDENQSEGKLDDGKTYTTYDVLSFASSNHIIMSILEADKKLDESASVEKTDYFSKLEQLYQQLPDSLYENYDVTASNISNYYQGFSSINIITLEGVLSRYNVEGLEPTRTYINNATISDSDKEYIRAYASYLTEYDLAFLDLVNDVKVNQGCTVNLSNLNACNLSAAASYRTFISAQNNIQIGDAYKLRSEYQKLAVDALLGIHKVIYGSGEGATE